MEKNLILVHQVIIQAITSYLIAAKRSWAVEEVLCCQNKILNLSTRRMTVSM